MKVQIIILVLAISSISGKKLGKVNRNDVCKIVSNETVTCENSNLGNSCSDEVYLVVSFETYLIIG